MRFKCCKRKAPFEKHNVCYIQQASCSSCTCSATTRSTACFVVNAAHCIWSTKHLHETGPAVSCLLTGPAVSCIYITFGCCRRNPHGVGSLPVDTFGQGPPWIVRFVIKESPRLVASSSPRTGETDVGVRRQKQSKDPDGSRKCQATKPEQKMQTDLVIVRAQL